MAASNLSVPRRSSRVPVAVPILVSTLEEAQPVFSEVCETLMVSAHGCSLRSPSKLATGLPVQLQIEGGKWTMAHIVDCQPLNSGQSGWMLGAKLDEPANFLELETYPEDWARLLEMPSPDKSRRARKPANGNGSGDVRALIAELVEPLRTEVAELKQKLERKESNRSQFEISLTHIPPEVQEKVGTRLREELGTEVMAKTRQLSEQVLEATKEAIGKRLTDVRNQFRDQLEQEVQKVEQRAQVLSDGIEAAAQQKFDAGVQRLEQQLLEAGIRLERRSEEFYRSLQQRLGEETAGYRREMQKVYADVAAEVAALRTGTTDLSNRMATLEASAQQLETDMEGRLVRVAGDIISGARKQLENALDIVLKDLGTRNAKELDTQLDNARTRLRDVQRGIEVSVSELVKSKVADSLVSFGQTMEILAQDSVSRWRGGLAKDLGSITQILTRQLQPEASDGEKQQ